MNKFLTTTALATFLTILACPTYALTTSTNPAPTENADTIQKDAPKMHKKGAKGEVRQRKGDDGEVRQRKGGDGEVRKHKGGDGEGKMRQEKHRRPNLAKDLNLTDEQKAQAKALREAGKNRIESLMKEMRALREKLDAVREENMAEFEKILTPEQKAKFKSMKVKHDNKKGKHKGDGKMHQRKDDNEVRQHKGERKGSRPEHDD